MISPVSSETIRAQVETRLSRIISLSCTPSVSEVRAFSAISPITQISLVLLHQLRRSTPAHLLDQSIHATRSTTITSTPLTLVLAQPSPSPRSPLADSLRSIASAGLSQRQRRQHHLALRSISPIRGRRRNGLVLRLDERTSPSSLARLESVADEREHGLGPCSPRAAKTKGEVAQLAPFGPVSFDGDRRCQSMLKRVCLYLFVQNKSVR